MKSDTYLPIFNVLRGAAAMGICIIHTSHLLNINSYQASRVLELGGIGVPIFFIISGFIIPYSLWNSNYKTADFFKFIAKRSVRIDPPFIVMIIICLLLGYPFNLAKIFLNVFYLVPFSNETWYLGIFWTLGVEFQFYIIIGLCFTFIKNSNIYLILAILLVLTSIGYFLPINKEYAFVFRHAHYFSIGIIALLFKKERITKSQFLILLSIISFYLLLKISITTAVIVAFVPLLILFVTFNHPVTDYLGKISYSLYLTHSLTGDFFLSYTKGLQMNVYFELLITLVFCVIAAGLFYFLVEKHALLLSKKLKFN